MRLNASGLGALGGVMVSKLDYQSFTSEFDSHWVPHSYGLVPHLNKKLSKFLNFILLWGTTLENLKSAEYCHYSQIHSDLLGSHLLWDTS